MGVSTFVTINILQALKFKHNLGVKVVTIEDIKHLMKLPIISLDVNLEYLKTHHYITVDDGKISLTDYGMNELNEMDIY